MKELILECEKIINEYGMLLDKPNTLKLLAIVKIQTEALERIDTDECCGDWCSARKSEIATSALTKASEAAK